MDEGQEMSINEKRELNQRGGTGLKYQKYPPHQLDYPNVCRVQKEN